MPPSLPPPREETTAAIERRRVQPPLCAIVRVVSAPATPRELHLRSGVCKIGAGPGADIVVEDETVSRRHAELELVPEGVALRDLGSRNGTFYLGQRVERMTLALGSSILLGSTEVRIEADAASLAESEVDGPTSYGALEGISAAMRKLLTTLVRLEGSLVTVLVEGESGTGKELVARALHDGSSVSEGPFVAVNCAELDRQLVRSELFGHKRGAFTGATEAHAGAFEAAHGGTLLLDEVGELPLDVQPMLLRALETGAITRLGENTPRPVKVRLVAATNRSLEEEVRGGRFRQDLYYRLMVVRLRIAPLRQRPEDIDVLAQRFAGDAGIEPLPPDLLADLRGREWPGNVRELKNAILAYAALGTLSSRSPLSGTGFDAALRSAIDPTRPYAEQKDAFLLVFTRCYLEKLLAQTNGNQSEAARVSGLERSYLGKLVAKLGLSKS